MKTRLCAVVVAGALAVAMSPLEAVAQEWRGMGRVGGKVVDESGKPIEGVVIKPILPAAGNRGPGDTKSNGKGEWAVGGISSGNWALDFEKEGYETRSISVPVSEYNRVPPMEVVLKKAVVVVDANAVVGAKLTEAAELMNAKKFAEARAMYEALMAEYPDVKQFKPLLARAIYGEGDKDKAIALLREASTEDPENVEVKLLLGTLLTEAGQAEEARTVMGGVDDAKVVDPVVFLNLGIGMINEGKQAEAIPWFDRAIARFPDYPDSYYYRGLSYVALGKNAEAKADLEKFVAIAKPDAPELAQAKAILESIK